MKEVDDALAIANSNLSDDTKQRLLANTVTVTYQTLLEYERLKLRQLNDPLHNTPGNRARVHYPMGKPPRAK